MAAPIASSIILPSDTGNSGKKNRTQTRVVGGATVHEHFMIPNMENEIAGKYFFSSLPQTVLATAQNGTSTGFFWFQMPAAATVTACIRAITADANAGSALATPTAPVISFTKFTFTGTASGASVTAVPFKTAGASNQMIIRTAVTGMTVSLVGDVGKFAIPSALTAVGVFYANKHILSKSPQSFTRGSDLEIAPGEGLLVYQSVNGTTSDTRSFGVMAEWQEIDLS